MRPLLTLNEQVCTFDHPDRVGHIRNLRYVGGGRLSEVEVDWGLGSIGHFYGIDEQAPGGGRPISDLRRAAPLDRSPTSVERWLADG